ncbi:hypothetical protein [Weissella hellenica]|nr:hypothetical protein WHE01_14750 [Weissella hellenica]
MVENKKNQVEAIKVKIIGKGPNDLVVNRQFFVKKGTTLMELSELARIVELLGVEEKIEKIITIDTKEHALESTKVSQ